MSLIKCINLIHFLFPAWYVSLGYKIKTNLVLNKYNLCIIKTYKFLRTIIQWSTLKEMIKCRVLWYFDLPVIYIHIYIYIFGCLLQNSCINMDLLTIAPWYVENCWCSSWYHSIDNFKLLLLLKNSQFLHTTLKLILKKSVRRAIQTTYEWVPYMC